MKKLANEIFKCPNCSSDNVSLSASIPYTLVSGNCFNCAWIGFTNLNTDDYPLDDYKEHPRELGCIWRMFQIIHDQYLVYSLIKVTEIKVKLEEETIEELMFLWANKTALPYMKHLWN